jgi:enoyl-CoA hydratase/carnithine racemase
LHAHTYGPQAALARGIVDAVVAPEEDVTGTVTGACRELTALAPPAYAETKRRMRASEVARVLSVLEDELPG